MLSTELAVLALAGLLLVVQYTLLSVTANIDAGWRWTTSPRDTPMPALRPLTGRLLRALTNLHEALVFYTAAVVVVLFADRSNALTEALAQIWLAARLLYLPAYAFGWSPWRSLIWGVGFAANAAMFGVVLM